jgi:hypothetical protein
MIERLHWERWTQPGELPSPFLRGRGERPIRITFHTSSFSRLSAEEGTALDALRQLARLPDIEALDTDPGPCPHITIGAPEPSEDYIPVQVLDSGRLRLYVGIDRPKELPLLAARLAGQAQGDPVQSHVSEMLADLLIAQAHCSLHRDILITTSAKLLEHRDQARIHEANPRTPVESARIVGLFLRGRKIY